MKRIILLSLAIISISIKPVFAQKNPKQAINVCAIAIPVMNMYVLNYEYLYKKRHGLAARIEYAPKLKGANTNGVMLAGVLNYRWHFSPTLKNFFIGPYARYRYVYGSGTVATTNYEYNVPEVNLGINGGWRWISKTGINVVLAAGYGYSFTKEIITPYNVDVKNTFLTFKNANNTNNAVLDAPFYGEVSIGYAF